MIKVTTKGCVEAVAGLNHVLSLNGVPPKLKYRFAKLARVLQPIAQDYGEIKGKRFKELGYEKEKDQWAIKPENEETWKKEHDELLAVENELDGIEIIDITELEKVKLYEEVGYECDKCHNKGKVTMTSDMTGADVFSLDPFITMKL